MTTEHKPLNAAEIEELRELEAKATKGPWAFSPYGDENRCGVGVVMDENDEPIVGLDETEDGIVVEPVAPEVDGYANAALITAMRNALPRLLAMLQPPACVGNDCGKTPCGNACAVYDGPGFPDSPSADAAVREAMENLALTLRLLGDSPPERVCIPVPWLRTLLSFVRAAQAPRLTGEQVEAVQVAASLLKGKNGDRAWARRKLEAAFPEAFAGEE